MDLKEFLLENRLEFKADENGLTVGGYLDLRGTGITALPDGLTVGGDLDLEGTGITALPDGLTVGGYLDLEGTGITALPDGLTVGGYLYLRGTGITEYEVRGLSREDRYKIDNIRNRAVEWGYNGRKYIKADGIFTEVDDQRGNVYHVHKILGEKEYLVTDGEGHWAHGSTLKEAKADLIYKIGDRDTSAYKTLSLDDTLTFEEAVAAYRSITGACAAGTRNFVEHVLPEPRKKKYSIREIIKLTRGHYGADSFRNFFTN